MSKECLWSNSVRIALNESNTWKLSSVSNSYCFFKVWFALASSAGISLTLFGVVWERIYKRRRGRGEWEEKIVMVWERIYKRRKERGKKKCPHPPQPLAKGIPTARKASLYGELTAQKVICVYISSLSCFRVISCKYNLALLVSRSCQSTYLSSFKFKKYIAGV